MIYKYCVVDLTFRNRGNYDDQWFLDGNDDVDDEDDDDDDDHEDDDLYIIGAVRPSVICHLSSLLI